MSKRSINMRIEIVPHIVSPKRHSEALDEVAGALIEFLGQLNRSPQTGTHPQGQIPSRSTSNRRNVP